MICNKHCNNKKANTNFVIFLRFFASKLHSLILFLDSTFSGGVTVVMNNFFESVFVSLAVKFYVLIERRSNIE